MHRKPKRLVSGSRRQQLHQDKLAAERCAQEIDAKAKQAEQQAATEVATAKNSQRRKRVKPQSSDSSPLQLW